MATNSPGAARSVTSSTACVPSRNTFETCSKATAGVEVGSTGTLAAQARSSAHPAGAPEFEFGRGIDREVGVDDGLGHLAPSMDHAAPRHGAGNGVGDGARSQQHQIGDAADLDGGGGTSSARRAATEAAW